VLAGSGLVVLLLLSCVRFAISPYYDAKRELATAAASSHGQQLYPEGVLVSAFLLGAAALTGVLLVSAISVLVLQRPPRYRLLANVLGVVLVISLVAPVVRDKASNATHEPYNVIEEEALSEWAVRGCRGHGKPVSVTQVPEAYTSSELTTMTCDDGHVVDSRQLPFRDLKRQVQGP
jgi:hypothetical protein